MCKVAFFKDWTLNLSRTFSGRKLNHYNTGSKNCFGVNLAVFERYHDKKNVFLFVPIQVKLENAKDYLSFKTPKKYTPTGPPVLRAAKPTVG